MSKQKNPKDSAALVRGKRPYTLSLRLCMDSMLTEEQAKLEVERAGLDRRMKQAQLRKLETPELAGLVEKIDAVDTRLDELAVEIEDQTVEFVFRAIPREIYAKMVREMPPTAEQIAEAKEIVEASGQPEAGAKLNVNPDTFPPALVQRALVSPKLTVDEVNAMWGDDSPWNTLELTVLFQTAQRASQSIALPR